MKNGLIFAGAACCLFALSGDALAGPCFPVTSEVVSLGEKAARYYAQRSLDMRVQNQQRTIASSGETASEVVKQELSCSPFPNLLGADEWRCTGHAKVCTKG